MSIGLSKRKIESIIKRDLGYLASTDADAIAKVVAKVISQNNDEIEREIRELKRQLERL